MNDFANIMQLAWNVFCTPITLYGFTTSYGEVYILTFLCSMALIALFKFLWG